MILLKKPDCHNRLHIINSDYYKDMYLVDLGVYLIMFINNDKAILSSNNTVDISNLSFIVEVNNITVPPNLCEVIIPVLHEQSDIYNKVKFLFKDKSEYCKWKLNLKH